MPDEECSEHDKKDWASVNMVQRVYTIPVCAIPPIDNVEGETEFSRHQITLSKVAVVVEKRWAADK
ncbi:hypothetical protein Tdes44962_MAKER07611 [Teratosphaeria destructans]|uniref:Uncharacterized protein n=1 Tax=Teratosphaeria destructans TaxID=418781 RepID=A0A9W7SZ93_9PEZI|nr:hypothetical protein Tdes44962_MAKER07611 [Teratosphaeria destructans]